MNSLSMELQAWTAGRARAVGVMWSPLSNVPLVKSQTSVHFHVLDLGERQHSSPF